MQALLPIAQKEQPRWAMLDAKREAAYHILKTGWADAGEDSALREFTAPDRLRTLPIVGKFKGSPLRAIPGSYVLFDLPDGDRLEQAYESQFHRWTRRAEVLARARTRRRVSAHIYALPLASALADLERARVGGGQFSWLGGTWGLSSFVATGRREREPGHYAMTAEEQTNRLRALLIERCDLPCMSESDRAAIVAAFDLLTDTAIQDEINEP